MLKTLLLTLPVLIGLFATGCADTHSESKGKKTKVRVQLNWFPESEFGGLYEAKRLGLFDDAGIDVELLKGGADVPAPQMAASGRVEFALVSGPQLLTLRSQGGGITGVFATFQKYPRAILVRDGSKYKSIEELWKSKATVLAQDGLAYIKWLNQEFGGKDLSFAPYTGSMAPFISGKVEAMQCFATAEPVQLEIDGVPNRVFLVADTGYNPYLSVIAVNDSFLKDNPEVVNKFVDVVREGWKSYLFAPKKTNDLLRSLNSDLKVGVLRLSSSFLPGFIKSDTTAKNALGWMDEERWSTLGSQLVKLGELTQEGVEKAGKVFMNPPVDKKTKSDGI